MCMVFPSMYLHLLNLDMPLHMVTPHACSRLKGREPETLLGWPSEPFQKALVHSFLMKLIEANLQIPKRTRQTKIAVEDRGGRP